MQLHLKKPLVFFDLETTGTNIACDRIVEISVSKVMPNGEVTNKTAKINPTIPIPLESSLIHGIYDNDVSDAPTFKNIAKSLGKFLEGCDFSGFNIIRFDVPVLVEEFLRAGLEFNVSGRKLVDSQKIFHIMEKRNLSAAYKFYCGKNLEDAHSAEADTKASYEVLMAQIQKYDGQEAMDNMGKKIGKIENDMASLHELSVTKMVDLAGRIIYDANGVECFNFGKHKGKSVMAIFEKEPSYYDWMMKGNFALETKKRLTQIKLRNFNLK